MHNIMLDLEYMGKGANAAICAIGAVRFNTTSLGATFYRAIGLRTSVASGGALDADTVLWWMGQSEKAREEIINARCPISVALQDFSEWVTANNFGGDEIQMWGNGAAVDNVILRTAYEREGIKTPWHFRGDRCFRTVRAMRPHLECEFKGTAHNALDDAIYQAEYMLKIFQSIEPYKLGVMGV
jgi:hypothetical protein